MKAKILIIILLISLIPLPSTTAQVPTASVSIDCLDDGLNVTSLFSVNYPVEEDPRQPSDESKTLYMFWNDSNTNAWSHFGKVENETMETYTEEKDDGELNIDLKFRMEPILAKRIYMDPDGLFRGSFDIFVEGDWTDGDGGACDDNGGQTGPKDCEELNITLMAGPNQVDVHHETGLVQGANTVVFNFAIGETTPIDWDGSDYNPEIHISMKLMGNYQPGFLFNPPTGDSAKFEIRDHAWKSSGISSRTRISNSWQKQHLNLPRLLSGNLPPVASRELDIQLINILNLVLRSTSS